ANSPLPASTAPHPTKSDPPVPTLALNRLSPLPQPLPRPPATKSLLPAPTSPSPN
ncbi:hypothetical protein RRG08_050672, partial [Elysia crispata]